MYHHHTAGLACGREAGPFDSKSEYLNRLRERRIDACCAGRHRMRSVSLGVTIVFPLKVDGDELAKLTASKTRDCWLWVVELVIESLGRLGETPSRGTIETHCPGYVNKEAIDTTRYRDLKREGQVAKSESCSTRLNTRARLFRVLYLANGCTGSHHPAHRVARLTIMSKAGPEQLTHCD